MAYINEKRVQIQAFKAHLSKTDSLQWGLAFNSNPKRDGYINGADLRAAFPRKSSSELGDYGNNRGAIDTKEKIIDAGKAEEFEALIEELFPNGIDETELNDLLWFDDDYILEALGITEEGEEEE